MTDWALAGKIGAFGFLTVFVVLSILSLVLWLTSSLLYKIVNRKKQKILKEKEQ